MAIKDAYPYTLTDDNPASATTVVTAASTTTVVNQDIPAVVVQKIATETTSVQNVGDALEPEAKQQIISESGLGTELNNLGPKDKIEIEVVAKVEVASATTEGGEEGTITSLSFKIEPEAIVTIVKDGTAEDIVAPNRVPVSDSMLDNTTEITVDLPNPLGAKLEEIEHKFVAGGSEFFHKDGGGKLFKLLRDDTVAQIKITQFSEIVMSVTVNNPYVAPAPSSSGGPRITYIGGNAFSASRSDAPTAVSINGTPVAFSANNGTITVSGMPANAKWVTVNWGGTSATTNFTPKGVVTSFAAVELPKTGDASVIAMAICSIVAAAAVFKKR